MDLEEIVQALYTGEISLENAKTALTIGESRGLEPHTIHTEDFQAGEPAKQASRKETVGTGLAPVRVPFRPCLCNNLR